MSTKKERLEIERAKAGCRLKECLDRCGMSQADLLERMEYKNKVTMTSAQLSQTIHGKRTLQPYFARKFAELLYVDAGYLLGADNFRFSCYADYHESFDDLFGKEYHKELDEIHKYDHILSMAGYTVLGMTVVSNEVTEYTVMSKGKKADIPAERMELFVEDLKKLIKKSFDPLMDVYEVK